MLSESLGGGPRRAGGTTEGAPGATGHGYTAKMIPARRCRPVSAPSGGWGADSVIEYFGPAFRTSSSKSPQWPGGADRGTRPAPVG